MAVYFQLTRLGDSAPSTFQQIDNAICQNLNLPWDTDRYALGWYDYIGFLLALGKTFQQITDMLQEDIARQTRPERADEYRTMLRINHFLLENYTADAWAGR
jgi:hypothetical protein